MNADFDKFGVTLVPILQQIGLDPGQPMAGPEMDGTLLGVHVSDLATYSSVTRPDGTLFGEGQGVAMTDDGEAASWRGQGVGRFTGHGMATSFRGAIYFQTTSDRLARLNGMAIVFEYEADESGKSSSKSYEWK